MGRDLKQGGEVKARAPATSANLGPGFDVFALAYKSPYDTVTAKLISEKGIKLTVRGEGADTIPSNPTENSAGVVALSILEEFHLESGIELIVEKGVPPGLGLGSSAASAVAAAYALNILFDLNLNSNRLIQIAARGEKVTAGVEHADNSAAAVLGGFVIVRGFQPFEAVSFDPPRNMGVCIATPKIKIPPKKTGLARSILPSIVSLEDHIRNLGDATLMVAGFATGRLDVIGRAMKDRIVEPARSPLIPGYEAVRRAVYEAGAVGVAISGAGPSMLALFDRFTLDGSSMAEAMRRGFHSEGIEASCMLTEPGGGVMLVGVGNAT